VAGPAREQAVPVVAAEQRPGGDGAYVDALPAEASRRVPRLGEPAELLLARRPVVDLGDRDRETITLPGLAQKILQPADACGIRHTQRLNVGVLIFPVVVRADAGVALQALVEEPLAREVVVDADDVGRARVRDEALERAWGTCSAR
jgi:hypothetical protein